MKVLFVDRDGCIIREPEARPDDPNWVDYQVDSIEKLEFMPGAISALQELVDRQFSLVLVTNQDGLGTPIFPHEAFETPHQEMLRILQQNRIEFHAQFICPHFPADLCLCRKPKVSPELEEYIQRHSHIDWENSFMIGDRDSDMELAKNLGCTGLKISQNIGWDEITQTIIKQIGSQAL